MSESPSPRSLSRRNFLGRAGAAGLTLGLARAVAADALDADANVYIVAVKTTRPVDVAVREIDEYTLAAGARLYRRLLERLAECEASGQWPGAYPTLEAATLPSRYDV